MIMLLVDECGLCRKGETAQGTHQQRHQKQTWQHHHDTHRQWHCRMKIVRSVVNGFMVRSMVYLLLVVVRLSVFHRRHRTFHWKICFRQTMKKAIQATFEIKDLSS